MSEVIASGVVGVRDLRTGEEWDEKVEVRKEDMDWHEEHGFERTVEDEARSIARRQAEPATVETLAVDIS